MANCSALEQLVDIDNYIALIRNQTNFDEALLLPCQRQICLAIWGEGNPDISGIGVSVGYVIEVGLGFLLGAAVLAVQADRLQRRRRRRRRWWWCRGLDRVLDAALDSFVDCALFFALAVQLASLVMLVQKDLVSVAARGFGANDARIATANSVVCILPLLHPLAACAAAAHEDSDREEDRPPPPVELDERPQRRRHLDRCFEEAKSDTRFALFYLLTLLFFVPFVLQCIHNWGPSRIGDGPTGDGTVVASEAEWGATLRVCFGDVRQFSTAEMAAIAVFELLGSLVVFGFAIGRLSLAALRRSRWRRAVAGVTENLTGSDGRIGVRLSVVLLLVPLVPAVPLLWGIFRLRHIQGKLADRIESPYTGNEWGFGQIIGLVIFAPVLTEARTAWKLRGPGRRRIQDAQGCTATHPP